MPLYGRLDAAARHLGQGNATLPSCLAQLAKLFFRELNLGADLHAESVGTP
ncbi:MAG: hypothetical protein HY704_08060 [Gemmatimonadetes bacterium]|nr:hypothetical protein [Gemmatimonadota bacterium]